MDVNPDYKKTEVGVIPEAWMTGRLRDLVDRANPIAYGVLKPGAYVHNGVPLLQIRDVIHGEIDIDQLHRISVELDRQYSRTRLTGGEVVVSLVGTIGRVALLPMSLAAGNLHRNLARILVSKEHDSKFVYYLLKSDRTQVAIKLTTFGSTQALLNLADLRNLPVGCPPLPEQRSISEALSNVDGLLSGLDRLIAKKQDLKRATMQQLLTGQTRLPGFLGEWEIASLEQVVVKATGVWGAQCCDESHPRYADIIRAGDISPGGELTATAPRYLSEAEFSKARCQLDDLVITTSGNGLGKVWWCDGRTNVAASNFVRVLRPLKTKANGRFLSYVLRSGEALRQLQEHTATSAYPNLRPTFFSTSWILRPPVPEQTAIAKVLTDMDTELAALGHRREKTRALKQAMMQELLTGRTRLM